MMALTMDGRQRTVRAHNEHASQSALILEELRNYQAEVTQGFLVSRTCKPRTAASTFDPEASTAFRHQYSFELPPSWKPLLGSDVLLTTSRNNFQTAYEFFARLPVITFSGKMAFVLSFTLRHMSGLCPNLSILGGGLNFVNIVPAEADVVVACEKGDMLAVHELFRERKAAPNDMTDDNRTLLYVSKADPLGERENSGLWLTRIPPVRCSKRVHGTSSLSDQRRGSRTIVSTPLYRPEETKNPTNDFPQRKQVLAASWWRHPAIARLLLCNGANVEVFGADGFTAASYLYGPFRPRIAQTEFVEILACNSFSHFNAQDTDGWTVLHRAAAWGTAADVRVLLQMKASTSLRTSRLNWTPLFCAVCYKNMHTLRELWDEGDDAQLKEQQDLRGWNLLHVAAGYANFEAVPFLLERGVDLHKVSKATSRFVPMPLRDKCVTPTEVARSCGEKLYAKWVKALRDAGHEVSLEPAEIDWDSEEVTGGLGFCECCESWNL